MRLSDIRLNLPSLFDCSIRLQGAKFIDYDNNFSEEEKKQSKALKAACSLNNAACKLKLKDYKEAIKLCTKVCIMFRLTYLEVSNILYLTMTDK